MAMLIVLNTFMPSMLMPPAVMFAIVIALLVPLVISPAMLDDASRCKCHKCQQQGAYPKSNNAHGLAPGMIAYTFNGGRSMKFPRC